MSETLLRSCQDLSGLNLDFSEPETNTQTEYRPQTRMRGELFNQPPQVPYLLGNYSIPMPVNLRALHQQRLIVIEVDVATLRTLNAEWPALSKRKTEFANELLPQLRSQYIGFWAKAIRFVRRKKEVYQVEGPFIPHQMGIALVSLTIRVGRESNFDQAYLIAKRFLELHPSNEDRARFVKQWQTPKPEIRVAKKDAYDWSPVELNAIEDMAPLEPAAEAFGADRSEAERAKFNDIIWRQCQERKRRIESGLEGDNDAAEAADKMLVNFFNRRI